MLWTVAKSNVANLVGGGGCICVRWVCEDGGRGVSLVHDLMVLSGQRFDVVVLRVCLTFVYIICGKGFYIRFNVRKNLFTPFADVKTKVHKSYVSH